ncbi:hypothetical protein Zmor_009982 [Zophobas morio]|uniref:Tyr recombinase domain-containing protein n=1 Tax=Zophobas morio TaxID=2755281 RepID=A0AA38IRM6_9CUCU|nr:hypothetical protein Zmor_009982 [Zophobas morio]
MCENVPEEIAKKGKELRSNLLPLKSKNAYENVYVSFQDWKYKNRIKEVTEDVILAFLDMRSQKLSPCSLWPEYSMLKATLKAKENIDIEKFGAVISYIKKLNVGYRGKKSNVLTREEIKTFLQEADDGEYLFEKVALIFGIAGVCRKAELCAMRFDDIQDCGNVLNIVIPDSKTHKERRFSVVNEGFGVNTIDLYRRYVALRPTNSPLRLFLHYYKGKCTRQNVGINTFGKIPRKIATFLKLENPAKYTSHSFRRSSATLLVNAGGDITSLKRHGGWESTKMAESYIQESFGERVKIAQKVFGDEKLAPNELIDNEIFMDKPTNLSYSEACGSSSSSSSTSKNTAQNVYFNNCTFNFGVNYCKDSK